MKLTSRFERALIFSLRVHADQQRSESGAPYDTHLLAVASLVMEFGGNENEAIVALLHDAAEDQGGAPMLEEIRRRFGESVAEIVEGCSGSLEVLGAEWKLRKESYVVRLSTARKVQRLVENLVNWEARPTQIPIDRASVEFSRGGPRSRIFEYLVNESVYSRPTFLYAFCAAYFESRGGKWADHGAALSLSGLRGFRIGFAKFAG